MTKLNETLINLQCEFVAERNLKNPQNISWLQYDILHLLLSTKEQLPSEMNLTLGISRTKLSKALKELKKMQYIVQKSSEKDGRELITYLTAEGRQLLNQIEVGHHQLLKVATDVFTTEEQILFAQLAEKLAQGLKTERMVSHE